MYEVLLHPDAQKVYLNVDKVLAKKIARCLQQLEQTLGRTPTLKPSRGSTQVSTATVLGTIG